MSAIAADVFPRPRRWEWLIPWVIGLIMAMGLLVSRTKGDGGGEPPIEGSSACEGQSISGYIRDGGTGDGDAWNDALDQLPASPARPSYWYVADGTYLGWTLNDAASGTNAITFCKATASDHGTETGWLSTYGDGQAVFGELNMQTDYYVFDGVVRDEEDWKDSGAYGFFFGALDGNSAGGANGVACSDHIVVKYAAISVGTHEFRPIHLDPEDSVCEDWLLSHLYVYNSGEIQLNATDSITIEDSYFFELYGKEAIRGHGGGATNTVIRRNFFEDSCRDDAPGADDGCTAEIGLFGDPGPDDFTGTEVYGNVFWKHMNQHRTDALVNVQAGCSAIFNNTVYDDSDSGTAQFLCPGGIARNNIQCLPNGMTGGVTASTADNNTNITSACPFVNIATGDFHLTGALAGSATGSPAGNSIDIDGVTRSTPDRGAFEFVP